MHTVIRLNPLLFHLSLPLLAGAGCIYFSGDFAAAYSSVAFPAYAPSAAASAAAWVLLSLLSGLSAYLVHTDRHISRGDRSCAMTFYGLVLVMEVCWFLLFFRYRLCLFASLWMVVIFTVAGLCAMLFYKIRRSAGLLLVPVLACLSFVSVVGFSVAALN